MTTATKERGIIMGAESVRGILEDRKTQTRRVINPQPFDPKKDYGKYFREKPQEWNSRYGVAGDRLWVRETWANAECMVQPHENDPPGMVAYRADKSAYYLKDRMSDMDLETWNWDSLRWKPSIHMPRILSRILLEVTEVRVQRVKEISTSDCWAEGIVPPHYKRKGTIGGDLSVRVCFSELWDTINSKRGFSWDSNPWVWVVCFKRLKP